VPRSQATTKAATAPKTAAKSRTSVNTRIRSDTLRYEHRRAAAEQLLTLPDAIAWCWAKGGDWRRRI
jgi:hypothetical protein